MANRFEFAKFPLRFGSALNGLIFMSPISTRNYRHIVVLTGAGISQASGIPTFRGPNGQLSPEYMRVSDAHNLPELLPEMWATHGAARGRLMTVSPNAAHSCWRNGKRNGVRLTGNYTRDAKRRRFASGSRAAKTSSKFTEACVARVAQTWNVSRNRSSTHGRHRNHDSESNV
jgi:hypothetical protein